MQPPVGKPLAFISHSSRDKERAVELADRLRGHGVDVWLDHEQLRYGDSVTKGISQGLEQCTVILVLISRNFTASSWCRAEYEPLLAKEIESGNTSVIPVRLDDSDVPILLRTKHYVDLRRQIDESVVRELAYQISIGTVQTAVNRHSTTRSYHCSLLSMVIGSVVKDFPVATMTDEQIVQAQSLIDLYRTVDTLVAQFQSIVDVLLSHELGYSATDWRIQMRKLKDTERELRTLVRAFKGLLGQDSALRTRLDSVFQLCVQIGESHSAMVVSLAGNRRFSWGDVVNNEAHVAFEDYVQGRSRRVSEYQKLLADLSVYRHDLREAIARLVASE